MHTQTKFILDYYLSNFDSIKYYTFKVVDSESSILKTKSLINLYQYPNTKSPIISKLVRGTTLGYIDRSDQRDSILGQSRWIWYKVRNKKGLIGWIWGNPKFIEEYY
jgi:hypothetical protein